MTNFKKTRNLSIYELFEILQREYVVCILRSKIYPYQKHKAYWNFVAEKKKEKVIDIATRNSLPHIFNNEDIKKGVYRHVYGLEGFPNFIYRDDSQRETQEKWDYINYFAIGSEVKINTDQGVRVGKVIRIDLQSKEVSISIDKKAVRVPSSEATRIL